MHSPTLGAHPTVTGKEKDEMFTNNSLELLRTICLKVKMDIDASFQTVKDHTTDKDENE